MRQKSEHHNSHDPITVLKGENIIVSSLQMNKRMNSKDCEG
jgi:hypothetical protein